MGHKSNPKDSWGGIARADVQRMCGVCECVCERETEAYRVGEEGRAEGREGKKDEVAWNGTQVCVVVECQ